uniref:VIT domain-containing protein n=1 Tax=Laticauda laticaudata TaxID=8630 RepID=A0A8C5S663_LATLA
MPGLYSLPSWTALPLQSSCVKACANGYTLGITANLTYINLEQQPVEGVFVYPLEESEVVSSFEAKTGNRTSTFQIQTRPPVDDCCLDCNTNCNQPLRCSNGWWGSYRLTELSLPLYQPLSNRFCGIPGFGERSWRLCGKIWLKKSTCFLLQNKVCFPHNAHCV